MRERFKVGVTEGAFQRGVGQRVRWEGFSVNLEGYFGGGGGVGGSSVACYGVQCCGLTESRVH